MKFKAMFVFLIEASKRSWTYKYYSLSTWSEGGMPFLIFSGQHSSSVMLPKLAVSEMKLNKSFTFFFG